MNMVFRVTSNQRLIIVDHAVEQMKSFVQRRWWQAEAGGVLLGRHLLDSDNVVVDEVTTPQATDQRSRFGFFRSSRHETFARTRWREKSSTMAYLGLWHTHPENDPRPSEVDCQDWQKAVLRDTFEGNYLFFPIVGIQHIRVWCLDRQGVMKKLTEEIRNGQKSASR
jgi:integrative and conjugative element protein (TIGR02256 family)